MVSVVHYQSTFHAFPQQIGHVVSVYYTQLLTNLKLKPRERLFTYQFSLPNSLTFIAFAVTRTVTVEKDKLGQQFLTHAGPVLSELYEYEMK